MVLIEFQSCEYINPSHNEAGTTAKPHLFPEMESAVYNTM